MLPAFSYNLNAVVTPGLTDVLRCMSTSKPAHTRTLQPVGNSKHYISPLPTPILYTLPPTRHIAMLLQSEVDLL